MDGVDSSRNWQVKLHLHMLCEIVAGTALTTLFQWVVVGIMCICEDIGPRLTAAAALNSGHFQVKPQLYLTARQRNSSLGGPVDLCWRQYLSGLGCIIRQSIHFQIC